MEHNWCWMCERDRERKRSPLHHTDHLLPAFGWLYLSDVSDRIKQHITCYRICWTDLLFFLPLMWQFIRCFTEKEMIYAQRTIIKRRALFQTDFRLSFRRTDAGHEQLQHINGTPGEPASSCSSHTDMWLETSRPGQSRLNTDKVLSALWR